MLGITLLVAAIPKPVIERAGGIMLTGAAEVVSGAADMVGGMLDDIASAIIPGYETSQRHQAIRAERDERKKLKAASQKSDAALRAYATSLEKRIAQLERNEAADDKAFAAERSTRTRDINALVARAKALESKAASQMADIKRALAAADSARTEARNMGDQLVKALEQWFNAPQADSDYAYDDAERMLNAVDAGALPGYLAASTGEYGLYDGAVMGNEEDDEDEMTAGHVVEHVSGDDDDYGLSVVERL